MSRSLLSVFSCFGIGRNDSSAENNETDVNQPVDGEGVDERRRRSTNRTMDPQGAKEYPNIMRVNRRKAVGMKSPKIIKLDDIKFDKTEEIYHSMIDALRKNQITNHLDDTQLEALIKVMKPCEYDIGFILIEEGSNGQSMYIVTEGAVQVWGDGWDKEIEAKEAIPESAFCLGEVALFYDHERTASVKITRKCKCYSVNIDQFYTVMNTIGGLQIKRRVEFLHQVHALRSLDNESIRKLETAMETVEFEKHDIIIRQAAIGNKLYIIESGEVDVYIDEELQDVVRTLCTGDYFGEKALKNIGNTATATCKAATSRLVCYMIHADQVKRMIGCDIDLIENHSGEHPGRDGKLPTRKMTIPSEALKNKIRRKSLLRWIGQLGKGGFGNVDLMKDPKSGEVYAVKRQQLSRNDDEQEYNDHELCLLSNFECDFIVKLISYFEEANFRYLLLEPCLGGELFSLLQAKQQFKTEAVTFYIGCIIEAFDYLHSEKVLYRDLKPENILVDKRGYPKLTDFGLARQIGEGERRMTFCGTLEYMAPEVRMYKSYDFGIDLWAIGILTYELLTGTTPFAGNLSETNFNYSKVPIKAKYISAEAHKFISGLLQQQPSERLGMGYSGFHELRVHPWFKGSRSVLQQHWRWEALLSGVIEAPHLPQLEGPQDLRYFTN